jgi:hypothetical protein
MVSRISSAVVAHTNGRGCSFQVPIQAWIDSCSLEYLTSSTDDLKRFARAVTAPRLARS